MPSIQYTLQAARQTQKALFNLTASGMLKPASPLQLFNMARNARQMGRSVATLAMLAAVRFPNTAAIIDERGTLSYAQLDQRVKVIAGAMYTTYGIQAGDTVALMCRNHRGFVEAFVAAMRLGANVVLLNTDFPGPQLTQVLARHDLKLLVHDEEFNQHVSQTDYSGSTLLAWTDQQTTQCCLDAIPDYAGKLPRITQSGKIILLTSGTTGTPKGAPREAEPLSYAGAAITALAKIPLYAQAPIYICPPLFHGFGIAFMATSLMLGAPMVIQRRFDPKQVLAMIEQHQVKTLVAVPVMLQRMLDAATGQQVSLSSLRAVLAAAAPLSAALSTRWMDRFGDKLYNLYGSTEVGLVSMATPHELRQAAGTVGLPPLGIHIKILDTAGKTLNPGETGHICVQSPMLFKGYVGGGHKHSFDGFMNSGDVGHLNEQGLLFIDGREDDMIISGGENVFPQEVEELLAKHPGVADVAVIGVADAEFGQRLNAFIVLQRDQVADEELLKNYIKQHLARYKMPREFVFLAELPRNITGKVLKKALAAM